jgi:uncharacterized protein DUF4266
MNARRRSRSVRLIAAIAQLACLGMTTGCAAHSVRAYQRERLADRIMSFEAQAKKDARLTKSFEAREGSTGGNGGAGGGCACK